MPDVYMDYAATTPLHRQVFQTMESFYFDRFGNPASLHNQGDRAEAGLEQARKLMLQLLGAKKGKLIFTGGGSEANNLVIKGISRRYGQPQKKIKHHIIVSSIEHDSVLQACHALEKEGFDITYLPVNTYGQVSVEDVIKAIHEQTILISIMHANNETGTVQPISEISKAIHSLSSRPFFHCDAIQTVGKMAVQIHELGIDLLTFSAHKFYGPKGVGGLYVKPRIDLLPLIHGGGQEYGFRSGTPNVPAITACAHALSLAMDSTAEWTEHYKKWNSQIRDFFTRIEGLQLTVPSEFALPSHIHFRSEKVEGQAIMQELSRMGVSVSTSSACHAQYWQPSHVMLAMGYTEQQGHQGIRVTLGNQLTDADILYFLEKLQEIIATFYHNALK